MVENHMIPCFSYRVDSIDSADAGFMFAFEQSHYREPPKRGYQKNCTVLCRPPTSRSVPECQPLVTRKRLFINRTEDSMGDLHEWFSDPGIAPGNEPEPDKLVEVCERHSHWPTAAIAAFRW